MKQLQDQYFRKAKREGYAARSAYKLEEIDRRKHLLKADMRVLDLGCAPGSWMQYAAERVGEKGSVLGIDLQPVRVGLPAWARAIEGDIHELPIEVFGKDPFDSILSDMAPKTTGVPSGDAARSARLALRALDLAGALLKPGGSLLVKVFQGAQFQQVRTAFREKFDKVTIEKPKATRQESVEVFLLGMGFQAKASK